MTEHGIPIKAQVKNKQVKVMVPYIPTVGLENSTWDDERKVRVCTFVCAFVCTLMYYLKIKK